MRMNQMIPPGSKQMCVMSKITSMLRNTWSSSSRVIDGVLEQEHKITLINSCVLSRPGNREIVRLFKDLYLYQPLSRVQDLDWLKRDFNETSNQIRRLIDWLNQMITQIEHNDSRYNYILLPNYLGVFSQPVRAIRASRPSSNPNAQVLEQLFLPLTESEDLSTPFYD